MKLTRQLIDTFTKELNKFIGNLVNDYKIIVLIDATIEIRLLVKKEFDISILFEIPTLSIYQNVTFISQITIEEYENELFLDNEKKIYFLHRRRFTELLEPQNVNIDIPVATFYSYKGGMGRTTALACFAAYMAALHNKTVVLVDCDFEAPGLSNGNYFFLDTTQPKNGIVEYLLDKEFSSHLGVERPNILKDNYCYDAINFPNSSGKIYVVPAGNLSSDNQRWYLEGLARIDLANSFFDFINDIIHDFDLNQQEAIILFDSRTGFNDTFATLAKYSKTIVGLFGINQQTVPGIEFFINHFLTEDNFKENINRKNIWFVKGLANDSVEGDELKEKIEQILLSIESDEKNPFQHNTQYISYERELTLLGTPRYSEKKFYDFINDINETNKGNFKKFFEAVKEFHFPEKKKVDNIIIEQKTTSNEKIVSNDSSLDEKIEIWESNISISQIDVLRKDLLADINYPELSGENYHPDAIQKEFFFRPFMTDIFSKNKFIILGGKGAGKTFLYRILNDSIKENKPMLEKICFHANKKKDKHIFINIINSTEPQKISSDYTNVNNFTEQTFSAYWKLLSCYAIFSNTSIQEISQPFSEDFFTWVKEVLDSNLVINQKKLDEVISQLLQVNKKLKSINKKAIISFDRLDAIIPLNQWDIATKSLLDFWGNNPILTEFIPKIFLRADLFNERKIIANNFMSLKTYATIDISWTADELFAYFFKILLNQPPTREVFYRYLLAFDSKEKKIFPNIKDFIEEIDKEMKEKEQLILDERTFEKLIIPIFGEHADYYENNDSSYPKSYNWFADNLKDGLNQINIRSFWELIKISISQINSDMLQKGKYVKPFPLISPKYYTEKSYREKTAKVYYGELEGEIGNKSLTQLYDFFQPNNKITFDKKYNYYEYEFKDILILFINKHPETEILKLVDGTSEETKVEGIIQWLINNGIITENLVAFGKNKKYTFPYFYRALFNLKKHESYSK